jgi:hypothetical protein
MVRIWSLEMTSNLPVFIRLTLTFSERKSASGAEIPKPAENGITATRSFLVAGTGQDRNKMNAMARNFFIMDFPLFRIKPGIKKDFYFSLPCS